jgi:peptidoglycan/LPS O-acetylase OafA/YrhL
MKIIKERRYDIDWLRVIAMLAVFIFHCARFFDTELYNFPLKNVEYSFVVDVLRGSLVWPWVMELFFLLSGFGSWYALRSKSGGKYLWDRFKRLLIPLYTVGFFILNPPQFYIESFSNQRIRGTFWESIPLYFSRWEFHLKSPHGLLPVPYGGHLWFLQYLFLISLVTLPLLLYLKSKSGQRWIERLGGWSERRGGIFLFLIPAASILIFFEGARNGGTTTWGAFFWYATFFVIGYIIAANKRFTKTIKRHGWFCLAVWIVLFGIVPFFLSVFSSDPSAGNEQLSLVDVPYQILLNMKNLCRGISFFAVFFILSLGTKYLNFNNKVLAYANEAVLPFYLLHQTVIVCVGWFVIPWNMGILPKFLIITVVSFPLILLLYELTVRRFNVVRFFFGMRLKKK